MPRVSTGIEANIGNTCTIVNARVCARTHGLWSRSIRPRGVALEPPIIADANEI